MVTIKEIENLAKLARIEISPKEAEEMAPEIDSILGYVGQIISVTGDIERIVPKLRNVTREDIVTTVSGKYTEKLLDNAPALEGNYIKVKKIL
ncbi:MAG: GatC [Parcubacteria group bacterium GW2011_GWF2_39_8b]|uniref:Aspartyl/glutamyl-tRNA(Asn/Gln) amidotransferase subunit C n=3 Tax=Candidatus Zambryskiibacteriota TaxID=1817925 RepID=A0A1G2T758_9BACT|nr:MAG: GatC [Parcubacteria group bacterium GW2011_GWF2_39_8b]KKR45504.1 MAG: GatC [Parcubacteria group bacterium GW2011_GWA2_40_14]OHA92629.1 MAG: hypothetical protein A2W58_00535 [Candidatus Zambryskibacteria bacterium RIFCSPHIGHO2_02_38_10.5]OHA96169.1 MAG: hypothetical protein A3C63_02265 [Candidatus Zambryskibacteria bacterium RIFCSPHIGHO2_02_FULL_39_82]OHA97597.1 MAG: hypothetical protein A3E32_02945 [Candidatus Zambryskibacteria bacterium RIFCSPHIGHO2_12_FULL_38_37]OHB08945.1 MAG: hypot